MAPWYLRERLVFGLTLLLCLTGLVTWFSISEQEDPFFPYRNGSVSIVAPGMSPRAIEQIVIQPLERSLSAVDEVQETSTVVSDGFGTVSIALLDDIYDTDKGWQRVREKVDEVRGQTIGLVKNISLEDKSQDTAGILLSIRSDLSPLLVRNYALFLRDELYKISGIRDIELIGDGGEQIEVLFTQNAMLNTGISPLTVSKTIRDANTMQEMGVLRGTNYFGSLDPITRIDDIESLKNLEVESASGYSVPLQQIATVKRTANPLVLESFWVNGERRVGLSLVLPPNKLRVVEFGEKLSLVIDQLNVDHPEFKIEKIFFQPDWTERRRNDLALSLFLSSVGVGLSLFFLMSRKLALIVSLTVPAIALSSLAFFGMFGGVLQQMSIAGLVISLGLMVDNSIVMSELIARYREQGLSNRDASKKAIEELYKPLATSTVTTIAAFLPMLLSKGNVADFIRMIPIMVITTIVCSYIFAIIFLPTVSNNVKNMREDTTSIKFKTMGKRVSVIGTSRPKLVLLIFLLLGGLTFIYGSNEGGEFFPKSDRNQAYIDIQGDLGTSHEATLNVVRDAERILARTAGVDDFFSFIGNSGPRFYYNMIGAANTTNAGRIVFTTHESKDTSEVVNVLNGRFQDAFTTTRVVARSIGQGPPIDSPIEIRVMGDSAENLLSASEEIFAVVNSSKITTDTRRDYVLGKPKLAFLTDDNTLGAAKLSKDQLSDFFSWRTLGINTITLPEQRQDLDVVIRDNPDISGSNTEYLMNTVAMNDEQQLFPVSLFVEKKIIGEPPTLTRRNGFRVSQISSDVSPGANEEEFFNTNTAELNEIARKYGVILELGGEAAEEEESNGALVRVLPVGAFLLFGALVLQFNSLRIAGTIMLTIPAAILGVNPMLNMVGVNFGFMSVLGILALTGIVVNTAIILIDRTILNLRESRITLKTAIERAVADRFRPIILTTVTTVVGMLPLATSASPLWPPLAWTMIGGLITSTVLSLVILPAFLLMSLSEAKLKEST